MVTVVLLLVPKEVKKNSRSTAKKNVNNPVCVCRGNLRKREILYFADYTLHVYETLLRPASLFATLKAKESKGLVSRGGLFI